MKVEERGEKEKKKDFSFVQFFLASHPTLHFLLQSGSSLAALLQAHLSPLILRLVSGAWCLSFS